MFFRRQPDSDGTNDAQLFHVNVIDCEPKAKATTCSTNTRKTSVEYEQFQAPNGAIISLNNSLAKATMLCLAERWRRYETVAELYGMSCKRFNNGSPNQHRVAC